MKLFFWIIATLVALVAVIGGTQMLASERVEVVELHTKDDAGEPVTTRLWIVDHDNRQYLRGDTGSGWYQRLKANCEFELTRGGETHVYTHALRQEKVATINQLFKDKYTWGDDYIELLIGGRDGALAIELQPVQAASVAGRQ